MPRRILIADGITTNRIVLKVKLSMAGFQVVQASSLEEAQARMRQSPPDLALIDHQLAGGGLDLCRWIRRNPATGDLPVLVAVDAPTGALRTAALAAGADDIVTRPLHDASLMARIRTHLRIAAKEREWRLRGETALQFGLAEEPEPFVAPPRVAVAAGTPDDTNRFCARLSPISGMSVRPLFGDASAQPCPPPDVVVLTIGPCNQERMLGLIGDCQSRDQTRHAPILILHDPADQDVAARALEMGASATAPNAADPSELRLRIERLAARKRRLDRVRTTFDTGLRLAMTDPLTGLFNRRYALTHLNRIATEAEQARHPFSVMVLDLDRFKSVNDRYGHPAGDEVLRQIGARLKANLRAEDMIARIGGEEFMVVMPNTDIGEAKIAAERLRDVTAAEPVCIGRGQPPVAMTVSIGLVVARPQAAAPLSAEAAYALADKALLGAKAGGRNQVTISKLAA